MTPSNSAPARVLTLRPVGPQRPAHPASRTGPPTVTTRSRRREPLWRHVIGDLLRRERLTQRRTLKDVSESARISMPYLSEVERGLKEASSEVLAAAAAALGLRLVDLLERAHRELTGLATDDGPYAVTSVTSTPPGDSRHTDLAGGLGPTTLSPGGSSAVVYAA